MSDERLRGERDRSIRTASRLAMDVAERDNLIVEYKKEIERLRAYANHERSLGAEGPMIELTQAKQEIKRLKEALREERQALREARAALKEKK